MSYNRMGTTGVRGSDKPRTAVISFYFFMVRM